MRDPEKRPIEPRHVRAFGVTLRLAVLDTKAERERGGARYYLDADVVYPMVAGMDWGLPYAEKLSMDLVRALISSNLFGPVYMLRPHGLEFSRHLSLLTQKPNRETVEQQANEIFDRYGVRGAVSALDQLIKESANDSPGERVDKLARTFEGYSSQTFVAIERVRGHWTDRLKALYEDTLRFDMMGPEISSLWQSDDYLRLFHKIMQKHRPDAGMPNMMDAVALASLRQMVADSDRTGGPLIRFHTETGALRRAWDTDQWLREVLSHSPTGVLAHRQAAEARGIVRSPDAFLMRMRFPELSRLPGNKTDRSLDDLEGLLASLDEVDNLADSAFMKAIEKLKVGKTPLGDLIQEFEDLSLMRSIWQNVPAPVLTNLQKRFGEPVRRVFAYVNSNASELGDKIYHIQDKLNQQLSQMAVWSADYRAVHDGGQEFRTKRARNKQKRIEDPFRDLGLVRWGFRMSKADTDWIISSLELLGSSVESDFEQNCFAVAGNVATARTNVKACVRTASLFWALERYQEAAKLVESLAAQAKKTRGSEPVPSGLRLMRAAARMRSKHGLLPQEKGRLLKELRAERSKIHDPEERGVYYLGLGYVIYSHWREVVRNDSADSDSARSLAQECFDLGNEAVSLLSKGKNKLAYAFALNHRAYSVATMGTPAADAWQRYFQPLLDLKDQIRDVWHARFDDTIGVYYLGEVKKHLAALDPEQGSLKSAEEAAQHAQEFLDDAQLGNTGGIDLEAHQNELIDLRRQIVERRRQWKEAVS